MNDKPRVSFTILFFIFLCMPIVLASDAFSPNPLHTVNQQAMGSPEQQIAISSSQVQMSPVSEQEQMISLSAASSPDFNQTGLNTSAELPVQGKKLGEEMRMDIPFTPMPAQGARAPAPQTLTATANVSSKGVNTPRDRPPFRAAALLPGMPGLPGDLTRAIAGKIGKQPSAEDDPVEAINSIINDNLYIWTTTDFYTGSSTVTVERWVDHSGPNEDVIEYVYVFNKWGSYQYYGYFNRQLYAYSTQRLPDLNIPASWILSNLGGNGFFEVYSLLQDINSNSIGEYSNQFGINALYAEGKLRSQETGAAIVGATAKYVRCSDNAQMDSSTTNSSGGYHLEVPFGTYRLMVDYNGYSYLVPVNGVECYNYASAGVWTFTDIYLYIFATLHGPVQDPDGNPLGGGVEWDTCAGQYVTGNSFFGTFQVRANPGSYTLRLNYNNVWYDIWVDGQLCKSYGPGDLTLSTLTLSTTATGTVKDELGNPQNGATVQFTDCGGAVVKSTTTNSGGYFSLTASPGNYILKVINNGYTYPITACNNWQWGTYNLGDIQITRLATLNGRVEGENDVPLSANVGWYTCADAWNTGGDFTGDFQLRSSPGNYKLKVVYNGITYTILFNGESCPHYDPGTYSLSDIQLISDITGLVKDENNQPIAGATVQFITCAGSTVKSTTTNANGRFYLTATAGNYKIRVIYSGSTYDTSCTNFPADSAQRDVGTLTIPVQARLIGSVRDEFGNPNTAYVEWDTCANQLVTGTLATGDFILSASTGSYKLKATYDGNPYVIPINGVECYQYSQPINYTLTSPLAFYIHTWLTGQVLNQQGYPIQGATAEFTDCANNVLATGQTASDGRFTIHTTPGARKFKIIHNSITYTFLINGQECPGWSKGMYQLLDPITLASDCSVYNNHCYDDHTKLFNCYYDQAQQQCRCYSMQCDYGCTEGLPECNAANQGTINVEVDDTGGNPLPMAKVYLDNAYQGPTDNVGKRAVTALFGYRDVKVNCPDGTYCTTHTIFVDSSQEYTYFDCACGTQAYDATFQFISKFGNYGDVDINDVSNFSIANVNVYIDGSLIGLTNPKGYVRKADIPQGDHQLRIEFKTQSGYESEQEVYWMGETTISIHDDGKYVFLIEPAADEFGSSNMTVSEFGNYTFQVYKSTEYHGEVFPIVAAIAVGFVILDTAMTAWDAYDAAQCVDANSGGNIGGECWDEALFLGVDFIPDGGLIPIINRIARTTNHALDGFKIVGKPIKAGTRRIGEITKVVSKLSDGTLVEGYIKITETGERILKITKRAKNLIKKFVSDFDILHKIKAEQVAIDQVKIGERYIQKGSLGNEFSNIQGRLGEVSMDEYFNMLKNKVAHDPTIEVNIIQGIPGGRIYTANYWFEFVNDGKQIKIWKIADGSNVGELDALVIVNGKPIIGEAKASIYETLDHDLFDLADDGRPRLFKTKIDPVKELALQEGWDVNPELLVIGPQNTINTGLEPGTNLRKFLDANNDWFDVEKFQQNLEEFRPLATALQP